MRKGPKLIAAVALGGVIATGLVAGATQSDTVFERLNRLEARAHVAEQREDQLRARIAAADAQLDTRWDTMDVSRRAADPIRVEVNRTFADWLGAFRAASREALHGPVAAEDSLRLLTYAAPRTLPAKLNDVDVIRRADEEHEAYHATLVRRAELSIALARTAAQGDTAREGRDLVVSDARTAGAKDDLVATDALLAQKLDATPPVDAQFDFHRAKGTLARPVSAEPRFGFGASAPLKRSNGLLWKQDGLEVRATAPGTVVLHETVEGWGRVLVLDHGGEYRSVYAHLGRADVKVGDRVERAAVIATSGDSGSLDGPRFHFELRKGTTAIDPTPWFLRR